MDLVKENEIIKFLEAASEGYFHSFEVINIDENVVIVYTKTDDNTSFIKEKKIEKKKKKIETSFLSKFKRNLELVYLKNNLIVQMEEGIKLALKSNNSNLFDTIEEFHLGINTKNLTAQPSITLKKGLSEEKKSIFRELIGSYLNMFGVSLEDIKYKNLEKELATTVFILKHIKQQEPIKIKEIKNILKSMNYYSKKKWIQSQLDNLRKKGFILRQDDESYVVTEKALRLLPHGSYRGSTDIARALELGRRKW